MAEEETLLKTGSKWRMKRRRVAKSVKGRGEGEERRFVVVSLTLAEAPATNRTATTTSPWEGIPIRELKQNKQKKLNIIYIVARAGPPPSRRRRGTGWERGWRNQIRRRRTKASLGCGLEFTHLGLGCDRQLCVVSCLSRYLT